MYRRSSRKCRGRSVDRIGRRGLRLRWKRKRNERVREYFDAEESSYLATSVVQIHDERNTASCMKKEGDDTSFAWKDRAHRAQGSMIRNREIFLSFRYVYVLPARLALQTATRYYYANRKAY